MSQAYCQVSHVITLEKSATKKKLLRRSRLRHTLRFATCVLSHLSCYSYCQRIMKIIGWLARRKPYKQFFASHSFSILISANILLCSHVSLGDIDQKVINYVLLLHFVCLYALSIYILCFICTIATSLMLIRRSLTSRNNVK